MFFFSNASNVGMLHWTWWLCEQTFLVITCGQHWIVNFYSGPGRE